MNENQIAKIVVNTCYELHTKLGPGQGGLAQRHEGTKGFGRRANTAHDQQLMNENQIARMVVNAAYEVHIKLGPGLLETVVVLAHELRKHGLHVDRQVPVPIIYDGIRFDEGFRADLIVADKVIVELKSVEALLPVHAKQVLTQIRLTDRKLGLLINFGGELIRDHIKRLINGTIETSGDDLTL